MRSIASQLSVALLLASLTPVIGQEEGPSLLDNRIVDIVTQTATDIWSVARELQVGAACVLASNPLSLILRPGDTLTVPESCCGNSCEGSFCGARAQCSPLSTSTSLTGVLIPSTTATSSTTDVGGIIIPPASKTINSNGETVILGITLPIGLRTIMPITLKDGSVITFTPEVTTEPKTTEQKTTEQKTTEQKTTEQKTTEQKTTSTTTSTTSSSSSCTSSTVTNVFLSCTPSGTTSSCKPTSTWLATGCSVTPTTVTCGILTPTGPIADPACNAERFDYVVYPKDGLDAGQISALENLLAKYVATSGDLTSKSAGDLGIIYWSIKLTKDQSEEVAKLEGVIAVNDNCIDKCPGKFTDGGGYRSQQADQSSDFGQRTIFGQLPYFSWARNPNDPTKNERSDTYVFDESAGLAVDVYMIDSGADLSHPDFNRIRVNTQWVPRNSPTAFKDLESHGTAVLGAITGARGGAAKNVRVFVAPIQDNRGMTPITILNAVIEVHNEIVARPKSTAVQAIINFSWSIPPENFALNGRPIYGAGMDLKLRALLKKLIEWGCLIVISAGNDQAKQIDRLPARYAKASDQVRFLPELLVVGSVTADGQQLWQEGNTDFADGLPHVYAPGVGITLPVATRWDRNDIKTWYTDREEGTSFSAGFTTGLAAYILSRIRDGSLPGVPNTVAGLRQHIIDTAWPRANVKGVDLKGIYNGAPAQANFCPFVARRHARDIFQRQEQTCEKLVNGDHDKPAPPDQFTNSLDAQPYICNKADDFKGHSDVREGDVQETAKHFCMDHQTFMTSTSAPQQGEYVVKKTKYEYEIRWLANCRLPDGQGTAQFTWEPNSKLRCQDVMFHAFKDCNNTGVGGTQVIGCLSYSFIGGRKI